MTPEEAKFILFKASAAYPNIPVPKETIAVWIERLHNVPFHQGLGNLNRHIDSSDYFPRIANIVNADGPPDHDRLLAETAERLADMESKDQLAIDCPDHLKPRFLKSGVSD